MTHEGKDWIFVADAHFTGRKLGEMDSFIAFLDAEKERMDHLILLGDLFEFLFGFKQLSSRKGSTFQEKLFPFSDYLPVFQKLQQLSRQGIRIKYFEGNHDFSLASFFWEHFGMEVEVYQDGCEERLGGRRTYVAHGDLSNPSEWRYRFFRKLIKNRLTYGLIQLAGPRPARRVARELNELSYQGYHGSDHPKSSTAFKAFAHQKFLEGFEVVILGHSHFPEAAEEWVDGRRCTYFNVGDWMTHRSFLRFTPPEDFRLDRFEEKRPLGSGQSNANLCGIDGR
ncbi:MAG: UDP-2,3-diacylglucosamine diphosphatase [Desulfobacterales bacterium]|nr:UDP-2,3-diacylglucosamine diphosphatase [Desulfobacterales bacterium]